MRPLGPRSGYRARARMLAGMAERWRGCGSSVREPYISVCEKHARRICCRCRSVRAGTGRPERSGQGRLISGKPPVSLCEL